MAKSKGKEGCKEKPVQGEKACHEAPIQGEKASDEAPCQEADKEMESLGGQVIHNLLSMSRLHRKKVESALARTELHGSQHRLLMHLSKCGDISQTELAKEMEVTSATIAVALKKLEKGGYIRKIMDEADNRYNRIAITEKGEQIILESIKIFHQTDREFFGNFTKEELEQLNQYLLRMKGR